MLFVPHLLMYTHTPRTAGRKHRLLVCTSQLSQRGWGGMIFLQVCGCAYSTHPCAYILLLPQYIYRLCTHANWLRPANVIAGSKYTLFTNQPWPSFVYSSHQERIKSWLETSCQSIFYIILLWLPAGQSPHPISPFYPHRRGTKSQISVGND